ncbi:MAG: tetratricopeptide repeat protein, partial [Spirochaetaceae bacterium]
MTRQQIKKRQEELKRRFDRAAKALKIGDVEQAGELARQLTRELPGRAAVHLLMGSVHSSAGRYDRAARSFEKAVEIEPDNIEAQNNLGVAYRQLGEFAKALAAVEQALAIRSDRSDVYYNLGNIHKSLGNFEDAKASYEKAIELDPTFALAYNNLGTLLHQNGDPREALRVLRAGLQVDANHPKLHYNLGLVYESLGELEEARTEYRESLTKKPGWTDALNNLGIVYQRLNRFDDSIDTFAEILELDPSNATALNNSANVLAEQGKVDDAIRYYRRALNNSPSYEHAISNMSRLLERNPDNAAASEELQQLSVQYPENHSVRLSLVDRLLVQKHREEANRHLDYLVKNKPDNVGQIKLLGRLLLSADRLDEAEECFRYIASQGDDKHSFTLELASIYRDLGRTKQARSYVNSYREDVPGSLEADLLLAKIELDDQEPQKALDILDMLKERAPDDERILVAIARAHQQMGEREQAIDAADELVNLQGQRARPDDLSRLNDSLSLYEKAVAAFEEDHGEAWARSLETLGKLARGEREETPTIQPLAVDELGELDEESVPLLDFGDDFDVDEEEAAAEPEDVDYLDEYEAWENDRGPSLLDLPNYGDRRGGDDDSSRRMPPQQTAPQPQAPPQPFPQQPSPPQQPYYQPPPPLPSQPPQAYVPPPQYAPPPSPPPPPPEKPSGEGYAPPQRPSAEELPVKPVPEPEPEPEELESEDAELDLSMGFPEKSPDEVFQEEP